MIGRPPDKTKKIIKSCKQCGDLFESYISNNRTFCSVKCSEKYHVGENNQFKKKESELKRYKIICLNCGKEIISQSKNTKFCSHECSSDWHSGDKNSLWKGGKITITCEQCEHEFSIYPCEKDTRRFCSRECFETWKKKSGSQQGENSVHWKGGKIILICKYCGNDFEVDLYEKDIKKFCSHECYSKYTVGNNHHNWKGGHVILICEQCGDKYEVALHLKDTSRFCSMKCMGVARRGENSPNWQGGISFDPYCEKFNPTKKKEVRDKYNNCDYLTGIHRDICNKTKSGKIHELSIHHIDYNKNQGCDDIPWKLVPVTKRHNTMFNKNEPFWEKLILYALEYDKKYYKIEDKDFNVLNI